MAPTAGDAAPDFTLPGTAGDVTLSSLRGKTVILYFYPKDNTPGCTAQACEFRDSSDRLASKSAVVLGISKDSLASHERFVGKFDLNFPLLSDPDLAVHKAYGAWGTKMMYGKERQGVLRTTVVLNPEGTITSIKHGVRAKGNAARTLDLL
jgi:peroxiredoxin Q/BCP